MDIVIIGTGNTATVLGRKLRLAGHNIVQVFGRDSMSASNLAYELDTESTNYWNVVNRNADIYLIAVSDIAIEEIIRELQFDEGNIVVHTAASVSKNIFNDKAKHFGVFYPLQSLKKEMSYIPDTPIIIDASDGATLQQLENLAETISTNVVEVDDDKRAKLHLAAVFVNNFVNHIYALAEKYCKQEQIDFELLLPLIQETAQRLNERSAEDLQTGPAMRNDSETISKHLELLQQHPEMKNIYELLTQSIIRARY